MNDVFLTSIGMQMTFEKFLPTDDSRVRLKLFGQRFFEGHLTVPVYLSITLFNAVSVVKWLKY